jgi:hypothetical protein
MTAPPHHAARRTGGQAGRRTVPSPPSPPGGLADWRTGGQWPSPSPKGEVGEVSPPARPGGDGWGGGPPGAEGRRGGPARRGGAAGRLTSNRAVCVWIPLFALRTEERRRPDLTGKPTALLAPEDSRRLWQVSSRARHGGVRPGLTVSRAIGLCPALTLLEADPVHYDEQFSSILLALGNVSPVIEPVELGRVFVGVDGLERGGRADRRTGGPSPPLPPPLGGQAGSRAAGQSLPHPTGGGGWSRPAGPPARLPARGGGGGRGVERSAVGLGPRQVRRLGGRIAGKTR